MKASRTVSTAAIAVAALVFTSPVFAVPIINGPAVLIDQVYNLALPDIFVFTDAMANDHAITMVDGQNVYNYLDDGGVLQTLTITRPDGSALVPNGTYDIHPGNVLSGSTWMMNAIETPGDPAIGFFGGTTLTFSSPVNAAGFELAHWATTGGEVGTRRPQFNIDHFGAPERGNGLWFSYDNNTPVLGINATSSVDNPGNAQRETWLNFVGYVDPTISFTSLTIFSDGIGDSIWAGGTVRFGRVPEPSTIALFIVALGALALTKWKSQSTANKRNIQREHMVCIAMCSRSM